MVELGIKGRKEAVVTLANVATSVGSGTVKVFSTPSMIQLMERAALFSIEPYLEKGQSSVGTHINVSHCAATPVGMKVEDAISRLEGIRCGGKGTSCPDQLAKALKLFQ